MTNRELDAWVHEKVLGHTGTIIMERGGRGVVFAGQDPMSHVPFYSTDIAAAWQVTEKMRKDGWYFSLGPEGAAWACFICRNEPDDVREGWYASASAPYAICKAALSAIGVELPKEA